MTTLDEKMFRLEAMLREQQAEIANLRETLARKNSTITFPIVPNAPATIPAETSRPQRPDPTRRKMLKRMGLAVLAGGAALGITAATYSPAEARISVNPSSNVGAIITRNGAILTGIPTSQSYGLVASSDPSFDASLLFTEPISSGIIGLASTDTGSGVQGYSLGGPAVFGKTSQGIGVLGKSTSGEGVYGVAETATMPGLVGRNNASTSGIALKIDQGGFTIKGAGISGTTSSTAAFVHKTTAANNSSNTTQIDNPLCNNRSNALLFVTHNYNPSSVSGNYEPKAFGVYYLSGYWYIYHEDASNMLTDRYFNVLIINP